MLIAYREPWEHSYFTWIPAGIGHVIGKSLSNFTIDFALRIDPLSLTMLMIVTWIGFLIHVYATGYMAHETGYTRFFAYLNLFMFMMLLLVLGANYVVMFVGWEGVGLCSYLLIGFYYEKNFAADAGKKAFVVNRIGDFGFILGIFLIFNTFGSGDYSKVFAMASAHPLQYSGTATAICLLLFLGAGVGAFTAAIFHVMTHAFFKACLFLGAGSVIHGCGGEQDMRKMGGLRKYMPHTRWTMLVAYLAIAGMPLFAGFYSKDEILSGSFAFSWKIWIVGAFGAGLTAFYMFRLYFMTFSGEYRGPQVVGIETSEPEHGGHDLIPDQKHLDQGDAHLDKGHGHHADVHVPHESPLVMTGVLMVLAVLSIIGGWCGWPAALGGGFPTPFQRWLEPVLLPLGEHQFHFYEARRWEELLLMALSVGVALVGIFIATRFYKRDAQWTTATRLATRFAPIYGLITNKYYVDEFYNATVVRGTIVFSRALSWFDANIIDGLVNLTRHVTVFVFGHGSSLIDTFIVDGAVNGLAFTAGAASRLFRRMQTGFVQNYALVMGGGIVLIAAIYLFLKP